MKRIASPHDTTKHLPLHRGESPYQTRLELWRRMGIASRRYTTPDELGPALMRQYINFFLQNISLYNFNCLFPIYDHFILIYKRYFWVTFWVISFDRAAIYIVFFGTTFRSGKINPHCLQAWISSSSHFHDFCYIHGEKDLQPLEQQGKCAEKDPVHGKST